MQVIDPGKMNSLFLGKWLTAFHSKIEAHTYVLGNINYVFFILYVDDICEFLNKNVQTEFT